MACDPNSSPWDWDAEAVFIPGPGNGSDLRKPTGNSRLSDTEPCLTGHGGLPHSSRAVGPSVIRTGATHSTIHGTPDVARQGVPYVNRVVGPAMANIHGAMASSGIVGHSNVVSMGQGRLPIVTTCIGNGSFIGCNAGSQGNVVQNGVHDSWGRAKYDNTEFLELGSKQPSLGQHKHHTVVNPKDENHLVAIKCHPEKSVGNTSDGSKLHFTEEQHSSTATGSVGSGDSLTGLHLGKRTFSQDVTTVTATKPTQKPNSAPKKARAGPAGSQIPRCQVEGCKLDLTSAKDYHRRHKVCEPHSKAGKVVVASLEQRFCQQCSRFHLLAEFDEAKRSCRRRLAGHNKRRRKPQPDPLELQARLRSTLEDWSFFHQPRFSRMSLWQDPGDFQSSGTWPQTTVQFEDQPTYDYTMQATGMERQMYMKGLYPPFTHDKFPLLLLRSPKTVMPTDASYPRVHQYLPGPLDGPVGNSLTLASSSTGAGVFSGLETTPATRVVTRVTDSGRALSLLSLQTQGSQPPDLVSLDLLGLANITTVDHQHMHEEGIVPQQLLLQGGQQHYHDFSVEKMMHSVASNSQMHSSGVQAGALEKDLYECSYMHDLNRQSGFESNHPMLATMQGHGTTGSEDANQTQDLMRMSSSQTPSVASQRQSVAFQLESSALGDLHCSYETPFF